MRVPTLQNKSIKESLFVFNFDNYIKYSNIWFDLSIFGYALLKLKIEFKDTMKDTHFRSYWNLKENNDLVMRLLSEITLMLSLKVSGLATEILQVMKLTSQREPSDYLL